MAWRPYQDTVGTWIVRSLSANGSSGTSAAVLMTPFRPCLLVLAATSPYRGRPCSYTVRPWVGRRQQPELPGVSVWRFPLSCRFPREEHLFPQQKVVGREFFFFQHQPDLLGRLTAQGLLYKCVCVTPSFFHVAST
jgi:hypothetical protein